MVRSRRSKYDYHGLSQSPTYKAWINMHTRCSNQSTPYYKNYGGRGISVCERWLSFNSFLSDMGERPDGHTLERLDNDGDYSPENCRWATWDRQSRNKRSARMVTVFGSSMNLKDACDGALMSQNTVRYRIEHGWDVNNALFVPAGHPRPTGLDV